MKSQTSWERYAKVITTGPLAKKLRARGYPTWRNLEDQLIIGDPECDKVALAEVTDLGFVYLFDDADRSVCDPIIMTLLQEIHAELVRIGIEVAA